MSYLQLEIIAHYHRDRLLREAEAERMANRLRSASTPTEIQPRRPALRRGLATLWPRLATQTG
jgi:hypothetical protein